LLITKANAMNNRYDRKYLTSETAKVKYGSINKKSKIRTLKTAAKIDGPRPMKIAINTTGRSIKNSKLI